MLPKKLAFVDIETTGTSLRADRIIEIGVLRVEDNKLVDTYRTLVNPETHLPTEIELITGITAKELENAPVFSTVRKDLQKVLEDCVFVAHNVRFDYGFIKNEFRREEINFKARSLCTVKLSRQLFPRFHHHSLDHIIERFGIECPARHRAFEDAEVLWKFYQIILGQFSFQKVDGVLAKILKRPSLPIGISEKILDDLPESSGVYVFYGKGGMPLYVGKSINIRNRVLSHFSSDHSSSTEMKIAQQVESIEAYATSGELGALFKEAKLVKELQPLYNQQLRRTRKMTVIKAKEKSSFRDFQQIEIQETDEIDPEEINEILGVFKSRDQAKKFLIAICKEFELCEKLLGLEKSKKECFGYRLGRCRGACLGKENPTLYNGRFTIAFSKNKLRRWPFPGPIAIEEKNMEKGISEKHIVDNWCYLGSFKTNGEAHEDCLTREIKFDLDTYKILSRHLKRVDKRQLHTVNFGATGWNI